MKQKTSEELKSEMRELLSEEDIAYIKARKKKSDIGYRAMVGQALNRADVLAMSGPTAIVKHIRVLQALDEVLDESDQKKVESKTEDLPTF